MPLGAAKREQVTRSGMRREARWKARIDGQQNQDAGKRMAGFPRRAALSAPLDQAKCVLRRRGTHRGRSSDRVPDLFFGF